MDDASHTPAGRSGSEPNLTISPNQLLAAAVIAAFGPWLVGMLVTLATPRGSWTVSGDDMSFLVPILLVTAFAAVGVWVGRCVPLAFGVLAGLPFALGAFVGSDAARDSFVPVVAPLVLSIGPGLAGAWWARRELAYRIRSAPKEAMPVLSVVAASVVAILAAAALVSVFAGVLVAVVSALVVVTLVHSHRTQGDGTLAFAAAGAAFFLYCLIAVATLARFDGLDTLGASPWP